MGAVRISDEVIRAMMKNKELTETFGILRKPPRKKAKAKGCGGCGGQKVVKAGIDMNAIRRRLAQMPQERFNIIKRAIGVKEARVRFKNGRGKVIDKQR